jgi:hypothetical protein
VTWKDRVLALVYADSDLIVMDVRTLEILGRVPGAGGDGCQEVLYDVSSVEIPACLPSLIQKRYRSDALSVYVEIDQTSTVVDILL